MRSCAFTGHRPNRFSFGYDENLPDCLKLKGILRTEIKRLIQIGVTRFYSGMAMGVDMIAAEIVLKLREQGENIELFCTVPCETQANSWSNSYRERYFDILAESEHVYYISSHYTRSCMYERNRYMIDHVDTLLAVYDGTPKGGTAYTYNYALKMERHIIRINPETFEVIE